MTDIDYGTQNSGHPEAAVPAPDSPPPLPPSRRRSTRPKVWRSRELGALAIDKKREYRAKKQAAMQRQLNDMSAQITRMSEDGKKMLAELMATGVVG